MAGTGILLLLLLIASSLLSVSYADAEPCSDSNDPQVLNALYYGVITLNGGNGKWCNISLNGGDYVYANNPYLAIADIVNSTECPSNENIYVNGKKFCIKESVTSLEVFPLNLSTSVNVSIPQEAGPFTLHYYNAILLCTTHPETADQITADGDDKLPKLFVSNGYVSFANHSPKDTCLLDLTNKEVGKVNVELVWPTLQTSTNISNSFNWSHCQLPSQGYTAIRTDVKHFRLKFTQWRQNSTDKIFIRVSTPCPAPESVGNGTVYSPKSVQQYILGDELYYICDKGFSKVSVVMVCQRNGSWSPTPPCTVQEESDKNSEQGCERCKTEEWKWILPVVMLVAVILRDVLQYCQCSRYFQFFQYLQLFQCLQRVRAVIIRCVWKLWEESTSVLLRRSDSISPGGGGTNDTTIDMPEDRSRSHGSRFTRKKKGSKKRKRGK